MKRKNKKVNRRVSAEVGGTVVSIIKLLNYFTFIRFRGEKDKVMKKLNEILN